jgi:hypothetical protein
MRRGKINEYFLILRDGPSALLRMRRGKINEYFLILRKPRSGCLEG